MSRKTNKEDEKTLKDNLIDFTGINYYHPTMVQHRWEELEEDGWLPEKYYAHYEWPQRRIKASKGWEIYPKGIYDIAMVLKKRYPTLDWFVSETGMGVHDEERFRNEEGIIQDCYRIGFLKEHLYWVHKAIDEGSLCFGFHVWVAFDCWSWNNAYRNRYGLVEVDINDQKRRIKASGLWYRDVAGQKGFAWDPADAGHP